MFDLEREVGPSRIGLPVINNDDSAFAKNMFPSKKFHS